MTSTGAVLEFAQAAKRRKAYFVNESIRDTKGDLIPCIAIEGVSGYYQTDWTWGKDFSSANKIAAKMNAKLGISEEDAEIIILSTMKPVTTH